MDKELKNLLDNYENVIYGKAFPINPSTHQLHLLLDYIANLSQQCKKQKEAIDKAIEYIKSYKTDYSPYELSDYNVRQILEILEFYKDILKEVE